MLRHLSRATLTRGHTFATGAAASATVTPRIAICGAGVSGLTLAGILSNGTRDVHLPVFERARRDRDQGYGLDLDEHGQEALVRANSRRFSRPTTPSTRRRAQRTSRRCAPARPSCSSARKLSTSSG